MLKKSKLIILISTIIFVRSLLTYSTELEEGGILLTINDFVAVEGFSAYFDEKGTPLIRIDEFFSVSGINEFRVEDTQVKFSLNGDSIIKKINTAKIDGYYLITPDTIEGLFQETSVKWDFNSMTLKVSTKERLPKEFLALQKKKREKLRHEEKEKVVEEEWKSFTPGILYLGYTRYDFNEDFYSLNANYTNQILYGNLNVNSSLDNGSYDVNNFTWDRYVGEGRTVTLGDTYRSTPFDIGDFHSLRGVNIMGKNSWNRSLDVNSKTIRGYAPNGSTVELYENKILKDYQIIRNGEFNFEIKTTGGVRNYEVWTYLPNGTIQKQMVALYGTNRLVDEGEFDYEIQFGIDKENRSYNPYNFNTLYGITEDFTFGVGGYNAKHNTREKEYINLSSIYRIGSFQRWSHLILGDFSTNHQDASENFYRVQLQSGNGRFHHTFGFENYKNLDESFLRENYSEKFYWRNSFSLQGVNTSISYEKEKKRYDDGNVNRYGITLYDTFFRGRISTSIDLSREVEKGNDNERRDNLEVGAAYNIKKSSLKKYINSIALNYSKNDSGNNKYGITLQKNREVDGKFDYYLSIKRENEGTLLELSFTYRLGDYINIRSINRRDSENTSHGVEVNTAIDFSYPEKIYYSEHFGDSSIKGRAFLDSNGNGIKDENERGIPQITVKNAAGYSVTDEKGEYYIPLMSSTVTHTLNITNKNSEYMMNFNVPKRYRVKTLPGGVLNLDIPVRQMKTIVGFVEFEDDFYLEEIEDILKNLSFKITNLNTEEVKDVKVGDEYLILELPQGEYLLKLIYHGKECLEVSNKSYLLKMSDTVETEEYLDFKVSKSRGNNYSINVVHNGMRLYSLDEIKDSDKRYIKGGK